MADLASAISETVSGGIQVLISVVTSVRNGALFLPRCLASVQTAAAAISDRPSITVEHVVCDGASTDGTVAILDKQSAARWISEPDSGQSEGFNKGVAMAKGDWICWLNADDELTAKAIASFLRALEQKPKSDIIYGHAELIDEKSIPLRKVYHLPYYWSLIRANIYVPPTSGTFFRRELLEREPLDEDYHYVMDVEWFLRCGQQLKATLSDEVFCRFRVSAQGKTSGMIKTGQITPRHYQERERYRRKYIYSQWPNLEIEQARHRLARQQRIYMFYYYGLKMRYVHRYLGERLMRVFGASN